MKTGEMIKIRDIIEWTSAVDMSEDTAEGKQAAIGSISTDSRTIEKGDFFIPIVGENFDGHDFIIEAVKKSCSGFVFQRDHFNALEKWRGSIKPGIWDNLVLLQTGDTIRFLLRLAAKYIRQFDLRTIGITGSVGKTTSKDFLANILAGSSNIKFTPANYNTEIGVACSVLQIDKETEVFIAELGMRAGGQIMQLCEVVDPEIGAITAVSPSHLEFFKNTEEIAMAKAEIGLWLKERGGVLFLNNDDPWTDFIIKKTGCDFLRFGRNKDLKYSFLEKDCDYFGRYSFDFYTDKKKINGIKLQTPGFHNIYNACCAASLASYMGVSSSIIKRGIENTSVEAKRMDILVKSGKIIINDCYNANPLSMRMAVDTLRLIATKNNSRSVAVLSDMLELGTDSKKLHFDLGRYVFDTGIDILITSGKLSRHISEGFESMLVKNNIPEHFKRGHYYFKDRASLEAGLAALLKNNDTILIKGSRAMRLETLIDHI